METIIKAILVTILVSFISLGERKLLTTKYRYLLRPIWIAPLGGFLLGNPALGLNIGLLVELIWGSRHFYLDFGLKYINLATILAVVLILFTDNISFVVGLTLALLLTYILQVLIEEAGEVIGSWFLEIGLAAFFLTLFLFTPVLQAVLGRIPAQFLESLTIARGLLPALGLAVILAQLLLFKRSLRAQQLAYCLALVVALLSSLVDPWLSLPIFFVFWAGSYRLIQLELFSQSQLRFLVVVMVVFSAPFLVDLAGPLITSQLRLVLWAQALLSVPALLLLKFKVTQFELYFLFLVGGIIFSKWGLLI
ncbi:PTS sugar transporter subunit IIC [Fuchsiella alkaliacetigena]|uniref:PTS sugar transporter subunit IIC n=1 Tax=Fuchsiella alkaliacetigena TaxID=957042 RepID=UPI00200B27F8|nr:PTS sugar transporter subunit IIC [Fuchsiella alkaliacetigena]MCK8824853.1 PTS sugar transporter subunit IIC [Fuchsiella alkaliacetigena]